MNDRFKFRAWHKPTKKMFEVYCFTDKEVFENTFDGIGTNPTNPANMNDCVLMQSTGLKDKNGRLIYEGDIVKTEDGDILVIKWGKNGFNTPELFTSVGFIMSTRTSWGEGYMQFDKEEPYYEVIGNIHENPELLEDK